MQTSLCECAQLIDNGADASHPTVQTELLRADGRFEALLKTRGVVCHPAARRRYLIAQRLDMPAAYEQMVQVNAWRTRSLPVTITEGVRAELRKRKIWLSDEVHLASKLPIVVVQSGRFDPSARDLGDALLATVSVLESALAKSGSKQVFVYYDRHGFDVLRNWDFEFLQAAAKLLSQNYPESLAGVYIYPSGPVLQGLWPLVAAVIDRRTACKVAMPDIDKLRAAIPPSLLP